VALIMALITALSLFLVRTLSTTVSGLLTDEFRAWMPWIIQRVIRCASARLPQAQQERFEEEWQSHVNEVPGDIGKLTVALGFLPAARKMTLAAKAGHTPLKVSRFVSRFGSAVVLLVDAPLMLIISLALFVSSGRVLAVKEEEGNGRTFKRLQFHVSGRLGKFLFQTSLYQLPELINGVRGEMTIGLARFWRRSHH
jgi:uncharacterized membrane protein YjgN (DUF898 family)